MKSCRLFAAVCIALVFFAGSSIAQWRLTAPNAIVPIFRPYNGGGVLTSFKGILWAGHHDVWMSRDTGRSWSMRTPFNGINNSCIKDIYFIDDNNGLATTQDGEIYITGNQGLSWTQHIPPHPYRFRPSIESACFAGTVNNIIACSYAGDRFVSSDGGVSWAVTIVDSFASKVIAGSGGTAYMIGGLFTGAWLYETNDFGATWVQHPAAFPWDSYSFERDRCDTSVFYVATDNYTPKADKSSRMLITANTGLSWLESDPHPVPYHCGSVSAASHAIFAQTFSGISRTTDQGLSWKDIGGPPNIEDTRFITALSDNLIVAVDSFGSVWMTNNSGGDSLSYTDPLAIAILTADKKTDTLGGSVAVPISLSPIITPVDIYMTIHFDPDLIYRGTFSLANMQLDIPGETWAGRSRIYIPDATSLGIIAHSFFDVFADSLQSYHVRFDSLQLCMKYYQTTATSVITPVSACGAVSISHFLRDSSLPELSIFPNPSSGEIFIHSTGDIGEANIAIFDMLGVMQSEKILRIQKNSPVRVSLPEANGMYEVMIKTPQKLYNLRVVLDR